MKRPHLCLRTCALATKGASCLGHMIDHGLEGRIRNLRAAIFFGQRHQTPSSNDTQSGRVLLQNTELRCVARPAAPRAANDFRRSAADIEQTTLSAA